MYSQIKGFATSMLPFPHLHSFCLFMGLIAPDDVTQSSLLEALTTKKLSVAILPRTIDILDIVAHLPVDLDPPSDDDEEDVSDKSNLLKSSTASMTELLKCATLEDVVIVAEKDDDGNIMQDDNAIKVMIATTIKGVAIKSIRMDILRPFCVKVGIQKIRAKSKGIPSRLIVYSTSKWTVPTNKLDWQENKVASKEW
jgi:uncharacterized protein with GYD domain